MGAGDAVAECVGEADAGEADADDAGGALDEAARVSVPEAQAARVRVTTRAARAAKGAETEE
ncbi:hypothetical protein [Microbacterium lacticum]|uniref:hypothetical protein n=1 Tax=Microbacterium lacticum TaxID=33885 RepID=UPI001143FC34|nr:hypothetical protein [Microbacterium lacticum]